MLKVRFDELSNVLKELKVAEIVEGSHLDQLRVYWWLADPAWKANIEIAEGHLRLKYGMTASASAGASSSGDSGMAAKATKQKAPPVVQAS